MLLRFVKKFKYKFNLVDVLFKIKYFVVIIKL